MAAKRKSAPKFKADPLEAIKKTRLTVAKAKRQPSMPKGTFHHGSKSASSSHRGMGGGGQHRDSKGRFS